MKVQKTCLDVGEIDQFADIKQANGKHLENGKNEDKIRTERERHARPLIVQRVKQISDPFLTGKNDSSKTELGSFIIDVTR